MVPESGSAALRKRKVSFFPAVELRLSGRSHTRPHVLCKLYRLLEVCYTETRSLHPSVGP
jgi:hypothetical protein